MRIEGVSSYFNNDSYQYKIGRVPGTEPQGKNFSGIGDSIEISKQARDYQDKVQAEKGSRGINGLTAAEEMQGCQTCKNRKYVDGSSDPSVSFQTPQKIDPSQAASRVMGHEREHVSNEQEKAQKEDRKVVSQTVTLSTSICDECGRIYVSGGVTRTITKNDNKPDLQNEDHS